VIHVTVCSIDVALDSVQPYRSVGQLCVLLHLQLPADVRRVVTRPGVPVYCKCAGHDGIVLAYRYHLRLTGRRPSVCHQLIYGRHQTYHYGPHPADPARH